GTGRFSVADVEGTNGLNFRGAADPRVVSVLTGKGFDNISPLYVLQKYTSSVSSVTVADGLEARLIRAEAELHGGTPSAAVDTLNAIRAASGLALAALPDPGTQVGREDLLFR